jgi:hypothetical protein
MALYQPEPARHGQDVLNRTDGMIERSQPKPPANLRRPWLGMSPKTQFILLVCATLLVASVGSNFVARWIGLPQPGAAYRRIGPVDGPQVFCAGSSLLQFGLAWPEISKTLGQGMENWGVGGSSPSEWEISQTLATNVNLMIVGVSVYDLNEDHLGNARANIVPLTWTIRDLWDSGMSWHFSKRLLSQYPLAYLREIFPTAGNADAVLVGLRRKLPTTLRTSAAAEDSANSMVVPRDAVMEFGGSTEKLSDWPAAKTLRRMALMRSETQGMHTFGGPKQLALQRMMQRAQSCGSNIVVVLPVAPLYTREFVTPEVSSNFEASLSEIQREFPAAQFVRLDQVAALQSDEYFSDPVHMNGAGREIATEAFLKALKPQPARP